MCAAIGDSTLGMFNSRATMRAAKARSRRKGFVSGVEMASMFAWLRTNDLIWNYRVNKYLLGNSPLGLRPAGLECRHDPPAGPVPLRPARHDGEEPPTSPRSNWVPT
jgi:hypothetical protein